MPRIATFACSALAASLVLLACATGSDAVVDVGTDPDGSVAKTDSGGMILGDQDSSMSSSGGDDTGPGTDSGTDSTAPPGGSHVVINELRTGDTNTPEFVELYNPTSSSVSLSGWEVRYASSGGNSGLAGNKFGTSDTIGPNSFLLLSVATNNWTEGMAGAAGQLGLFNAAGTTATKIDGVAYGSVSGGTLHYGEGTTAPVPTSTGSVGRKTDGLDTDVNGNDFVLFATPTPGASN